MARSAAAPQSPVECTGEDEGGGDEAHGGLWVRTGYPAAGGGSRPTAVHPYRWPNPLGPPLERPTVGLTHDVTRSAGDCDVHRQPRPTRAGPTEAPIPGPEAGEGGREGGGEGQRVRVEASRQAHRNRTGHPCSKSALRGTKAREAPATAPAAETRAFPIDGKATLRQA